MDAVTLALAKAYTNSQRNGYVEYRDIVCFPEAEFEFIGAVNLNIPGNPFGDGDTVTVVYDGVEYVRTAKFFPEEYNDLAYGYYVGNLKFVGGEDTGEPFALLSNFNRYNGNFNGFIVVDTDNFVDLGNSDSSAHRIGCKVATEEVHPIDPKFLPGAVLPVVELETMPGTQDAPAMLTDTEILMMEKIAAKGEPCIISFQLNGDTRCKALFNYTTEEGSHVFNAVISGGMTNAVNVAVVGLPGMGWAIMQGA